MKVTLSALAIPVPGRAKFFIRNWDEDVDSLQFSIQRSQDLFYLHGDATWSNNQYWFQVPDVKEEGEQLVIEIDKQVVDPVLEVLNHSALSYSLRQAGVDEFQSAVVNVKSDGLLSSLAGAGGAGYVSSVSSGVLAVEPVQSHAPEPEPVQSIDVPPVVDDHVVAERPEASAPEKNSVVLIAIVAVLVITALMALLWFFLLRSTNVDEVADIQNIEPAAADNSAEIPPAEKTGPPVVIENLPCSKEAMTEQAELPFVQACVKSSPDSTTVLSVIEQAKASERCGVAQRLYAHKGQSGDVVVAQAYAREYDPKYHQASVCFTSPDVATAVYWYETIIASEPNNGEALARLAELKQ